MKKNKIIGLSLIAISLVLLFYGFTNIKFSDKEDEKEKEREVTKEEVEKYLSYIPVINDDLYNVFQTKMVTVDKVPTQLLLNTAYSTMGIYDVKGSCEKDTTPKEECDKKEGTLSKDHCYVEGVVTTNNFYFKEDKFIERVKNMYGKDIIIEDKETLSNEDNCSCYLENEFYYCYCGDSTTEIGYEKNIIKLDKYEQKNDILYIYVKHLHLVYEEEDESGSININVLNRKNGKSLGYIHGYTEDELFEKYGEFATPYVNVYKKNDDGSYYWYSTEQYIIRDEK